MDDGNKKSKIKVIGVIGVFLLPFGIFISQQSTTIQSRLTGSVVNFCIFMFVIEHKSKHQLIL